MRPKGDTKKAALALREKTSMTRQWIANRLGMGSASYISQLTAKTKDCRLCDPFLVRPSSGNPPRPIKPLRITLRRDNKPSQRAVSGNPYHHGPCAVIQ